MTNEQITKALECCIHDDEGTKERPCQDCPLLRDDACSNSLRKLSLDLIKSQKAEIERLKARNDELNALNKSASIEAAKEFVKCFEKKIKDVEFTLGQTWEIQNALKDTLKEMVGADNA